MKTRISRPWTQDKLDKSIRSLKANKARDPHGLVNELLMEGSLGQNMKDALLTFVNGIKDNLKIPTFMNYADITSIMKQKKLQRRHVQSKRNLWDHYFQEIVRLYSLQ